MKVLFLFISIISLSKAESIKPKSFYLRQIDYRKRATFSVSIPGMVRVRLRPFYEFRYKVKKKIIPVKRINNRIKH